MLPCLAGFWNSKKPFVGPISLVFPFWFMYCCFGHPCPFQGTHQLGLYVHPLLRGTHQLVLCLKSKGSKVTPKAPGALPVCPSKFQVFSKIQVFFLFENDLSIPVYSLSGNDSTGIQFLISVSSSGTPSFTLPFLCLAFLCFCMKDKAQLCEGTR